MSSMVSDALEARVASRARLRRRRRLQHYGLVLLFLSPWILGFCAFFLYPMGASLYYSFTSYDLLSSPRWVGFANYRFLLTEDPLFWQSVRNTLWIIVIGVPLRLAFAIFTAMLLTAPRRGVKLYRTLFYLPTLAPPVAAVLAFVVLLNPENGPVDQALGTAGLPAPLWFQDPAYAKWGLVLLGLWGVGDA